MAYQKKLQFKRRSSAKQKIALAKGQRILAEALKIQKQGGTHTIEAKKVYNKNLAQCMKSAAKQMKLKGAYR